MSELATSLEHKLSILVCGNILCNVSVQAVKLEAVLAVLDALRCKEILSEKQILVVIGIGVNQKTKERI